MWSISDTDNIDRSLRVLSRSLCRDGESSGFEEFAGYVKLVIRVALRAKDRRKLQISTINCVSHSQYGSASPRLPALRDEIGHMRTNRLQSLSSGHLSFLLIFCRDISASPEFPRKSSSFPIQWLAPEWLRVSSHKHVAVSPTAVVDPRFLETSWP
jgi:hypothetical protein